VNIRLIKPGSSKSDKKHKQVAAEGLIIETLRSWVRDFQSTKADRARLDSERINNPGEDLEHRLP